MQVSEVLRIKGSTLFVVTPDRSLADCVTTMSGHDIGSLVVMEKGTLLGMLTFREILRAMASDIAAGGSGGTECLSRTKVAQAMIKDPIVARPHTEVDELRRLMLTSHQRYLPVMNEDGTVLQGVVSFHDVARAVLEEQGFENRMLKAYIRDWPAEG